MPLRACYVDLDGTLLGRGASLMHDGDGNFTTIGVRALEACARADVEVVIYSGRRNTQVHEDARLLGHRSYIFEAGGGLVMDGETTWLTAPYLPRDGASVWELVEATGAPALVEERFAATLEPHAPWHLGREVSHVYRGLVDPSEVEAAMEEAGLADLRLVDNGGIAAPRDLGIDVPRLNAYHLVPRSASKANGVAMHMRARGYVAEEVIAVGDSREDASVAGVVGEFFLVANALLQDPTLSDVTRRPNVRVTEESFGAGVYEAVVSTLAIRR